MIGDKMTHLVSVGQLRSMSGGAFFNVDETVYAGIGVWGSCSNPTYLLKKDQFFSFMTFSDQGSADEWLSENSKDYEVIKLDPDRSICSDIPAFEEA